jgi:hypothetical protein
MIYPGGLLRKGAGVQDGFTRRKVHSRCEWTLRGQTVIGENSAPAEVLLR